MMNKKHTFSLAAAVFILLAALLPAVQPVQAASPSETTQATTCASYHIVRPGETLSGIGAAYRVAWKTLAEANGISSPYKIYSGQRLCIPAGAATYPAWIPYPPATSSSAWNFRVVGVKQDQTVTIETANFPDNTWFEVEIGCLSCGLDPVQLADLDTDRGGTYKQVFDIPDSLAGYGTLVIRLTQPKKDITVERVFANATFYRR